MTYEEFLLYSLLFIIPIALGITFVYLAIQIIDRRMKARDTVYVFHLHDCTKKYDEIIINAHHFYRKDNGGLQFFDSNDNIVFDTNIMWTNVYRQEGI